jgi:aminoglycoside 3-N-acetyltransferase I
MAARAETTMRRLGPGDEDVVRRLATRDPQTALLADERTIFLVAFEGDDPVGFVFGYELPRRHGAPSVFFVYEVEVDEAHRRRGIATGLMQEALRLAGTEAFVLTDPGNEAGNALYRRLGGEALEVVQWDF